MPLFHSGPIACILVASLAASAPLAAETSREYEQRQRDRQYEATRDAIARPNTPNAPMTSNGLSDEDVARMSRNKEAAERSRAQRAEEAEQLYRQEQHERAEAERRAESDRAAREQIDSERIHREMSQIDTRDYRAFKLALKTIDAAEVGSPEAKDAIQIITRWSNKGEAEAQAALGCLMVFGLVPSGASSGRDLLYNAVRANAPSIYMLRYAEALEGGFGGPVDLLGARCWYRAIVACNTPDAVHASHVLGRMDELGQGASIDQPSAARWYRAAAKGGDLAARLRLAEMQRDGLGMVADPSAARAEFTALSASEDAEVAGWAKADLR